MNRIIRKIVLIVIILLIIVMCNSSHPKVYASTEAEQLTMFLDEYKNDIGNIEQFKNAIDQLYNDLNSATKVDDELKRKLNEDIDKLAEVEGMNPLILNVLEVELRAQADNLTDETLPQMKEEILVIKQWADAQEIIPEPEPESKPEPEPEPETKPEQTPEPETNKTPTPSKPSTPTDNSTVGTEIPKAGITSMIILVIGIFMVAIFANKKYKNLDDI